MSFSYLQVQDCSWGLFPHIWVQYTSPTHNLEWYHNNDLIQAAGAQTNTFSQEIPTLGKQLLSLGLFLRTLSSCSQTTCKLTVWNGWGFLQNKYNVTVTTPIFLSIAAARFLGVLIKVSTKYAQGSWSKDGNHWLTRYSNSSKESWNSQQC